MPVSSWPYSVEHIHRISVPQVPLRWLIRGVLLLSICSEKLNTDYANWINPQSYSGVAAIASEAEPFEPLLVYAPHYYDTTGQTAQSYDFTLVDPLTDSDYVTVPSPCPAVVVGTNHTGAAGYGHHLEFQCTDTGHLWLMAHFAELHVTPGQTIRKGQSVGIQGSTGNSTGPHVHAEIDVTGDGVTDAYAQTERFMEQAIAFWEAGVSPVSPIATAAGSLLSDEEIQKTIAAAEGTVDWHTLEPDADYQGHTDPCVKLGTCSGRGTNRGYFSSDQGATPEAANAYQLGKLREAEQMLQQQAIAKFGGPLSKEALANGLDLYNQAPQAALDEVGGYVDRLPRADPTDQEIIEARAQAFIDPRDGQLKAPGLGGTWVNTVKDQKRRQGAISHAKSKLEQRGGENREK
jgi:hypothetical protein